MEEVKIQLATAKLASEKKFDWPVYGRVIEYLKTQKSDNPSFNMTKGEIEYDAEYFANGRSYSNKNYAVYARPTQELLHKWLREIHGLYVFVIPTVTAAWTYKIITVISKRDDDVIMGLKSVSDLPPYKGVCGYDFGTYELALEDALVECLKQVKLK